MSTRKLFLVLAVLVVGVLLVPGAVGRGLAAELHADSALEPDAEAAPPGQFCMQDNFNRIFKLNQIVVLLIGQLWATPVNGFVFGVVLPKQPPGVQVQMAFFDPTVLTFWTCQGTGSTVGYFNGTCKAGQQTLPWGSFKMGSCPF